MRRVKIILLLALILAVVWTWLSRPALAAPPWQTETDSTPFDPITAAFNEGAYQTAIDLSRQLLVDDPDGPWADDAQFVIGTGYYYLGEVSPAQTALDKLIMTYPGSSWTPQARQYLDLIRITQAGYQGSPQLLQKFYLVTTETAACSAPTLEQCSHLDGPVEIEYRLQPAPPNKSANPLGQLVQTLSGAGQPYQNSADPVEPVEILDLEAATAAGPETLLEQAQLRFDYKTYDEARRFTGRLVEAFPDSEQVDEALLLAGQTHAQQGRHEAAISLFRQVVSQYPDSDLAPQAQAAISLSYYHQGLYDKAEQEWEKLKQTYPDSPEAGRNPVVEGILSFPRDSREAQTLQDLLGSDENMPVEQLEQFLGSLSGGIIEGLESLPGAGEVENPEGSMGSLLESMMQGLTAAGDEPAEVEIDCEQFAQEFSQIGQIFDPNQAGPADDLASLDMMALLRNLAACQQGLTATGEAPFDTLGTAHLEEQGLMDLYTTLLGDNALYSYQGRYEEALAGYQRLLNSARGVDDRRAEALYLNDMGTLYGLQGNYAEALESFEQALTIARELEDQALEVRAINNIGLVYQDQGRFEEALDLHQQALTVYREVGYRPGEGYTLSLIGRAYLGQEQYDQALETYQQALPVVQEVGERGWAGHILHNLAEIYAARAQYDRALDYDQQALTILEELGDRDGVSGVYDNLGRIYTAQEQFARAEAMYRKALDIQQQSGNRLIAAQILSNLGHLHQTQGQYNEALARYQEALDTLESIRASAGSEQSRAAFIAQYAPLYADTIALFHQQGQDEAAFLVAERSRARSFLDSLATGQVQLQDDEVAGLLAEEQAAYERRQAAETAVVQARYLEQAAPDELADLEARLVEAEAAHNAVVEAIEARGEQLAALVPGRGTQHLSGVEAVQGQLGGQTTMLYYYLLDEQALVFIITPDHFEVVELALPRDQLSGQVSHFRDLMAFKQTEATRQAAQELHQALIEPLAGQLKTRRLLIVPHGVLHYLPFAALWDAATGEYLIEQHELVMLPGASTLPFLIEDEESQETVQDRPAGGEPAVVVGNPATAELNTGWPGLANRNNLAALPQAEAEARAIAGLYGVEPLLGQAATETVVRQAVAGAELVHLAAHGFYNPIDPLNSRLALAPDPQSPNLPSSSSDGWLTVSEVYGLDLSQTDLVVLSACQTQIGELSAGDEVVGLTRSFMFAGAPSVMATLWNVDDAATGRLMERFYTHLQNGQGKAAALRQAQLELLQAEATADPFYWSGFVLSGDGGQTVPELDSPSWPALIAWPGKGWVIAGLALLIVILAVVAIAWRQRQQINHY